MKARSDGEWELCGHCGCSLTSSDYEAGFCTNCRKETNPMTQMRYHMDNGLVMVEHTEREVLEQIRKNDPRFRRRHIYELLQMRPSQIAVGVVYEVDSNPPRVADQTDAQGVRHFHDHNGSRVDYPKATRFRDGYVQP